METVSAYPSAVEKLGQKLRALRERLELQQTAIARRVRKTEREVKSFGNYLSRVERGDPTVQNPSLEMIEDIARGMGLTLSVFFSQLEAPSESPLQPQKQSATTKEGTIESSLLGAADDRSLPEAHRRAVLIDVAYALLDAAARVSVNTREQTPTARPERPRLSKGNRGSRG